MPLVAGIDSSTQSCKIVIRHAESGALVRQGRASHPDGTEIHPDEWWSAFERARTDAGGLDDVAAIAVGGQQHGMVCLDESGAVVRPALLWNDTRSAAAATELVQEFGGAREWADAVGSVPVAAFTVTKLRWLAEHEPANAERTAAVCLPHDWLTWKLNSGKLNGGKLNGGSLETLATDRGDASGTGYWSPATGDYRDDLLRLAFGRAPALPRVLGPAGSPGTAGDAVLGAGTGDNMAAALGVGVKPGDVIVSLGTSGVVSALHPNPTADPSGDVAGFASATGDFLPLVCTLNAARVLDSAASMLGVNHDQLSELALSAPAGSGGLVVVPYLEGERTPNRPDSTGALHGMTLRTMTPAHVARAIVEGLLCGLADGLDAMIAQGVEVERIILVGGGARSEAVCALAPTVLGRPVLVPVPGEYVADGAARQAAWVLSAAEAPPDWQIGAERNFDAALTPGVRERYAQVRELTATRVPGSSTP